jgi:hypothetical protein
MAMQMALKSLLWCSHPLNITLRLKITTLKKCGMQQILKKNVKYTKVNAI